MEIKIYYIDECPSWRGGLKNLKAALRAEGLEAKIRLIKVPDNATAGHLKFLGSPSFQANGRDLWPEERERYNLNCRVYKTPQGLKGAPTAEMLRAKLRAISSKDS